MGDLSLVSGTRYRDQSSSYSRQIQYICRQSFEIGQTSQNRMGFGSVCSKFHFPNAQLSQCGLVCDVIQSQTPIVCISSSGQPCLSDRRIVNELELSSCICIFTNNSDTLCSSQDTSISVQKSSYCSSLPQLQWFSEVLQLLVSAPILLQLFPKLLTQSKGRFQHPNLPLLALHAWELSSNQLEIKCFRRRLQTLSQNQDKHLFRKSMMQNGSYTPIGVIERRFSAPLTVIAHFLIYLFSEKKKNQISTIKGYRSMISNTLKFKTGNGVGSNPVLSVLIKSFELQRPVQRSLTPKWDLSWFLVCPQKAPSEPLHKASELHVTIKTAFLLGLATAKRCRKIHALAMDANHLRFNQSDGSVSLIVQSGFLAKNQLPSISPV